MTTSKTTVYPDPRRPVLVRADEAERLDSIGHSGGQQHDWRRAQ